MEGEWDQHKVEKAKIKKYRLNFPYIYIRIDKRNLCRNERAENKGVKKCRIKTTLNISK